MKKILSAVLIFTSIFVLLLCGCPAEDKKHLRIANEINRNTTLELGFLENVEGKDLSSLVPQYGWFGADGYYNSGYTEGDEYYVNYVISAYPDYADGGQYVTRIVCTDPNVIFFGDNTLNNCEGMFEWLSDEGFEIISTDDDPSSVISAYKNHIKITYDRRFNEIVFNFEVSNRKGMEF